MRMNDPLPFNDKVAVLYHLHDLCGMPRFQHVRDPVSKRAFGMHEHYAGDGIGPEWMTPAKTDPLC